MNKSNLKHHILNIGPETLYMPVSGFLSNHVKIVLFINTVDNQTYISIYGYAEEDLTDFIAKRLGLQTKGPDGKKILMSSQDVLVLCFKEIIALNEKLVGLMTKQLGVPGIKDTEEWIDPKWFLNNSWSAVLREKFPFDKQSVL